jgi:hypothetical protein
MEVILERSEEGVWEGGREELFEEQVFFRQERTK